MKLADILSPNAIQENLEANDKKSVLKELAFHLAKQQQLINPEELFKVLVEREALGSTGLEHGVAIPHGKLLNIHQIVASFARSLRGVTFDAMDGQSSHLFFLLVAPENSAGAHLKVLARVSRLVKELSFRDRLMKAKNREELYQLIILEDEKF